MATVADVLIEVRGAEGEELAEGWEDRAAAALEQEEAADKPRSSLVAALQEMLGLEPVKPDDEGDGTVWFHTSTGDFHVTVGSPAHEKLHAEGAGEIPPPG